MDERQFVIRMPSEEWHMIAFRSNVSCVQITLFIFFFNFLFK